MEIAKAGFSKLWETAEALREIRDKRLYREHYPTFEAFVREEFGKSRDWAYKLIAVEKAVKALPTTAPRPTTIRQARELLPKRPKKPIEIDLKIDDEKPAPVPMKSVISPTAKSTRSSVAIYQELKKLGQDILQGVVEKRSAVYWRSIIVKLTQAVQELAA
jgi:hypothetical protein